MASGVAAGVQAGAAFGPYGAAVGGLLGGATDVLSAGASGGPFLGGAADSATHGTTLDGSGFSVNFGGTQVATPTTTKYSPEGLPQTGLVGSVGGSGSSPLLLIGLAVVAVLLLRRRKG